jgi:Stage II sporulation protein E (SpoIIE)
VALRVKLLAREYWRLLLVAFCGALCAAAAQAQSVPFQARIGNSVVILTGPWKFSPGDNPAWAQPGFNDSHWGTLSLSPPAGSYDPVTGSSGYVPGWTVHGYPNLVHFAWYRLHIRLENGTGQAHMPPLAITMPLNFDDAYQVFVNGRQIGEFGKFNGESVTFYNSAPRAFSLPADLNTDDITIAVRLWMDFSTPLGSADAGGLHGPPILGEASSVNAMLRLEWDSVNRTQVGSLMSMTLLLVGMLLGFILFWLDRSEPAYGWLGVACFLAWFARVLVMTGYYATVIPMSVETFILDVAIGPLSLGAWSLFWGYWFRLKDIKRIARWAGILVFLLATIMSLIRPPLYGRVIPVDATSTLVTASLALKLLLGAVLLWVTYSGIRKREGGGWLVIAPILLTIFWSYQEELSVVHVPVILRVYGLTISTGVIAIFVMLAIVSLLMLKRFIRGLRERELWKQEIEQARVVQQVLIPDALPAVPGFQLASEYRPAQQVGGDFFQILALPDSGILAVIGDVSGKGMPAAMTVSLLVGTLRTLAHFTHSPREILEAMNYRMLARSHGGFTTCLVLHITSTGQVTAANAGHLSPYLQGREITIENGLPLGLSADTKYTEATFRLPDDTQLTLISDGVVEARRANGELLGFDRTAAIASESASKIADEAQQFGQSDDITVLTVTRVAAGREGIIRMPASELSMARGTA